MRALLGEAGCSRRPAICKLCRWVPLGISFAALIAPGMLLAEKATPEIALPEAKVIATTPLSTPTRRSAPARERTEEAPVRRAAPASAPAQAAPVRAAP